MLSPKEAVLCSLNKHKKERFDFISYFIILFVSICTLIKWMIPLLYTVNNKLPAAAAAASEPCREQRVEKKKDS